MKRRTQDLEQEATQLEQQHAGDLEKVFENFDPNTGKRIRPDTESEAKR